MTKEPTSYLHFIVRGYRRWRETYIDEITTRGPIYRVASEKMGWHVVHAGSPIYMNSTLKESYRPCLHCLERVQCPECARRGEVAPTCSKCRGLGSVEVSTGGWKEVDGVRLPYHQWLALCKNPSHEYWRLQHKIGTKKLCEACGGTRRVFQSEVIGVFFPTSVVRIVERLEDALTENGTKQITIGYANQVWPHNGKNFEPGYYFTMDVENEASASRATAFAKRFEQPTRQYGGLLLFEQCYRHYLKRVINLKKWKHPWLKSL